jgi:chorismate mutase/prephenate dehydratase
MKKDSSHLAKISSLRASVNEIDSTVVNLLSERRKLSLKLLREKSKKNKPIRAKDRENEILERVMQLAGENGLDKNFAARIFRDIIEDSVVYQQQKIKKDNPVPLVGKGNRIALQGIAGSYSALAAKKFFGGKIKLVSKKRFDEVINAVESGEADYGVLPIDNTTSGGINEVHDLLLSTDLKVIGEEYCRVNHCLAAIEEVPLEKIKKIFAHYQAEAQCSIFISSLPNCSIEYFPDTAMSFKKVKEEKNRAYGAIASEAAAKLYGLKILKKDIANQANNFTRFLVLSRKAVRIPKKEPVKTSIIMTTLNKPGALADALGVFKRNKINLTRLESRPVPGNPWEELFFIDLDGNVNDANTGKVLKQIESKSSFFKILGSYKKKEV